MHRQKPLAFTLVEILVVVSIIGLLAAILLPSISGVRRQSLRVACMSNLKQIGVGILTYRHHNRDVFPTARSIPEPWVEVTVEDPPLPEALQMEIPKDSGIYACPGDKGYVHRRSGISYIYNTSLSGRKPEAIWLTRTLDLKPEDIPVAFDFDGTTAETTTGETVTIPFFHSRRNLLFADGHVGDFGIVTKPTHNPHPGGSE